MSKVPENLKYTKTHEWVRQLDDGRLEVGITDHAQGLLGDIVFVELPELGGSFRGSEECAVIESVKAASDIYSPVGGEVIAVNEKLTDTPEIVNRDPYGEGWIFRLQAKNAGDLGQLLDAAGYSALIAADTH